MIIRLNKVDIDIHIAKSRNDIRLNIWRQDFLISTNVNRLAYDDVKEVLYIEFKDGEIYEYLVSFSVFQDVLNGRASTRTAGEWGPVGKTPSNGAAVHKYLIDRGVDYRKGSFWP